MEGRGHDSQSRTDWRRVVTFGNLAEYTRTLAKDSYVMLQGATRTREFERDAVRHETFDGIFRSPYPRDRFGIAQMSGIRPDRMLPQSYGMTCNLVSAGHVFMAKGLVRIGSADHQGKE